MAVIARVPFDEGTLTGNITLETTWPEDDWRSSYFVPENLISSVEHADALRPLVPDGMTMPEMALRFILNESRVHTIIPGMVLRDGKVVDFLDFLALDRHWPVFNIADTAICLGVALIVLFGTEAREPRDGQ